MVQYKIFSWLDLGRGKASPRIYGVAHWVVWSFGHRQGLLEKMGALNWKRAEKGKGMLKRSRGLKEKEVGGLPEGWGSANNQERKNVKEGALSHKKLRLGVGKYVGEKGTTEEKLNERNNKGSNTKKKCSG